MKEQIAVIGMGGLFPGSKTLDEFWDNLVANKSLVTQSTTDDFGASPDIFYDPEKGKLDKCYSLRGGYVRDFYFDPKGYGLDADLLAKQPDQFQWSLYVARQALEDSGYWGKEYGDQCGVIIGNLSFPSKHSRHVLSGIYAELTAEVSGKLTGQEIKVSSGNSKVNAKLGDTLLSNAPAALIAQALGLKKTHFGLDAACASSLYAVKLACDELRNGRADMMLAGAVSGADPLFIHMGFSYFHAYAREDEPSQPMHGKSGGLTSAEGAGMVVLKRLSDAQRDNDNILAVIDGVGLSNDGHGKFLLSPNPKGQKLAFERAYIGTDVKPGEIDYLECHATGTPLGDNTEFDSIDDFFVNGGTAPKIGGVKSNMGHLLTAAGMAGMIKVILGMQKDLLPATIKVEEPLKSSKGNIGTDQIVMENIAWPKKGAMPRAGVNTFGFGGTNAHMIVSAYDPSSAAKESPKESITQALDVIGMDLHFGGVTDLDQFYISLFNGTQHFTPLPENRWKGMEKLQKVRDAYNVPDRDDLQGAWLEEFELDLMRFKIQPKEAERLTLQQTLMLKVASAAMSDAGLDSIKGTASNIAVITAMESELEIHHRMGRWDMSWQVNEALQQAGIALDETQESKLSDLVKGAIFHGFEDHSPSEHLGFIGNIISSRISALMDFTGPSFTVSSNENAVYKALEIARNMLATREVDAVVLGAIDLTGSMESVISRQSDSPMNTGVKSMGWNVSTNGWNIGEGAGAIVLKRTEDTSDDRVYATIEDIAIVQSSIASKEGEIDASSVETSAATVLNNLKLESTDIGLLEVSASGVKGEDDAEIAGLTQAYKIKGDELTCALGTYKAHIGHTFSASGISAIIKTSLSLYYRFLPGVPQWEAPKHQETFSNTPFYVPSESRPWITERGQKTRRAAISGLACDGTAAHLVLSEAGHPTKEEPGPFIEKGGERLFPLKAASYTQMIEALDLLNESASLLGLAAASDRTCEDFVANSDKSQKVVVLIAKSVEALLKEIQFFQEGIEKAWEGDTRLLTPRGSCFVAKPLGGEGKIALMYPGSGSAYQGMGTGIFQAFPELHDFLSSRVNDVSNAFFSKELYQRSLVKLDSESKLTAELGLQTNALPMMASGCTYAAAYTRILQEYLKVKGDSVMGCSMGETSAMWYSQGVWDAHLADEKFLEAPLFKEWVGGDMKLLAKHWNMSEKEARNNWLSSLIRLPQGMIGYKTLAEWYEGELSDEKRVFLTFVHTDTEIIISGHQDDLNGILDRYGIRAVSMKINNVVHHDFCNEVMDQLLVMHDLPVTEDRAKTYYSGLTGKPLDLDQKELSQNAADVCCNKIDWPFLLNSVYGDDHKIFIELGPNATCTRWTDEILAGKEYVAIPSDRKGRTALRSLTGMVSALLAHGVDVDLSYFYTKAQDKKKLSKVLMKTLQTGGPRYEETVLTTENISVFQRAILSEPVPTSAVSVTAELELEPVAVEVGPVGQSTVSPPAGGGLSDGNGSNGSSGTRMGENGLTLQDYHSPTHLQGKNVIWNEKDLLTFAEGKIADVFGEEYAVIDTYRRRVMLPMPPYLLVSRVTKLDAELHNFRPSKITTEYDIPYGAFYSTDGQVPWAVGVESGQCDLLLISYLGIDFEARGDYVYRLLDCTLTFLDDLPFEGQTLRYNISINSYVRNDRSLLFFFSYECFVEDRMVLKMDGGCAGFFTDEELSKGQGVVYKNAELEERKAREKKFFHPFLTCKKTTFDKDNLLALVNGDLVTCFGPDYNQGGRNKSLRMPPEGILMLDRITEVDIKGGNSGIGYIEAELDMQPGNWYFPCHFRDDEVLAGSLQAEGGGQLLRFFMLLLGMQKVMKDARFQPVLDIPQKVRCRKEIPPNSKKLIYRMDVKEIGLTPEPYVIADLEIIYDDLIAVHFENLGLRLQEKDNPQYLKPKENLVDGIYVKPVDKPVLLNERDITKFALGPVHESFGDEYKVFEGRELSRQPNTDLQFISRVLEVRGERHHFVDKPTIIAEYDVPADAWYYEDNASPVMPYSVLMEVALQPCGFLGAYLGSTLSVPDKDIFFRNLDGDGELFFDVDLRGKTITNTCILVSHTNLAGTVLQRYEFELVVDGKLYYKGQSSFGFFSKEDLSSQAGLDKGDHRLSWIEEESNKNAPALSFNIDSPFGKMKLLQSTREGSPNLHLATGQLNLLDKATYVKNGGIFNKGYIHASKEINTWDWFFTCHFYQDPVMPGSLGIEALFEAIQLFALQEGLGANIVNASFDQTAPHRTVWKYRGQILQHDPLMNVEVNIKEVKEDNGKVIIIADGSLWKGTLRIYEVTNMAITIC